VESPEISDFISNFNASLLESSDQLINESSYQTLFGPAGMLENI
jgi:hypothetical protein